MKRSILLCVVIASLATISGCDKIAGMFGYEKPKPTVTRESYSDCKERCKDEVLSEKHSSPSLPQSYWNSKFTDCVERRCR